MVGPVEDVRLVGAFDDDIVFRRSYASGRAYGSGLHQLDPLAPWLGLADGWTHNFQVRLLDLSTRAVAKYVMVREDGSGYRFNADFSDSTGEGWSLTPTPVTDCAGATTTGWAVVAADGTRYELDSAGRLVRRRVVGGQPVTSCYDQWNRLDHVQNSSGQSIWFTYDAVTGALSSISRGAATGPVLAAYAIVDERGRQLHSVCYGAACAEHWDYTYGGGSVLRLLTRVEHGGTLVEQHTYCAQAGGCPLDRWDAVRFSSTPTAALTFTYRDGTCGGTRVVNTRLATNDPYRSSCLTWDSSGHLSASSAPTGCTSAIRGFDWAAGNPLPTARAVAVGTDGSGHAVLAWTTRTFDDQRRLTSEVENDAIHGSNPPAEVRRLITYAYGDPANPRLPTRIERPSVFGGVAATTFAYNAQGNVTERHEQGYTSDATGATEPYDYVTYTEYLDLGGGKLRPWRIAGPIAYVENQSRPWHTEFTYYDATGNGDAARAYRLKEVKRYPQCPEGSTCAATIVERTYAAYDPSGRPSAVVDANGLEIDTTYDHAGRVTATTRGGKTTAMAYDAAGRVQLVTLPAGNGVHSYYENDSAGFSRLKAVTRVAVAPSVATNALPAGTERTVFSYDAEGNTVAEDSRLAPAADSLDSGTRERLTQREFFQRRVKRVQTAAGNDALVLTYDPMSGALTSRTEQASATQTRTAAYTYTWGRLTTADGTHYGYNGNGDLTTITDETGRVSTYSFDDLGRLLSSNTPSGGVTRFWYSPRGDLLGRQDAAGHAVGYEYDALGRVLGEVRSSGAGVSYVYDTAASGAIGRLAAVVDTAGASGLVYDAFGRVTAETRTNGSRPARTIGYGFDDNDNLSSLTYPDGTVLSYTYVAADPAGVARDPDQVRAVATGAVPLASGVSWHAGGGLAALTYGSGAALARGQTLDGAPASIAVSDPVHEGAKLLELGYTVDWLGRPTAITRQGPGQPPTSESYGFDGYGRLTTATISPALDGGRYDRVTYRYTGPGATAPTLGNRTQEQRFLGADLQRTVSYGVGAKSSLVSENGALVGQVGDDDRLLLTRTDEGGAATNVCAEFDAAGNQTYSGFGATSLTTATACATPTRRYCTEHDAWGRVALAGEVQPDGSCGALWRYDYDWRGRRVAVTGEGAFAAKRYEFFYDTGDRLLSEYLVASDGSSAPEHNYYWLAGEPLAQERRDGAGGVLFYHNDHLGTPQRMSTMLGAVKWAARYSPFGELGEGDVNAAVDCELPLADNPLRFPGQYDDRRKGTGSLVYNYHRYYDPAIGRYSQQEPVLTDSTLAGVLPVQFAQAGLPQLQPYAYAANAPTHYVDLDGSVVTGHGGGPGGPGAFGGAVAAPGDPASAAAALAFGAAMSWLIPKVCKPKPKTPDDYRMCYIECTQSGKGEPFFFGLFEMSALGCKAKAKLLEIGFRTTGHTVSCTGQMVTIH